MKIDAHESIKEMLKFLWVKILLKGRNAIIRNLRFEHDLVAEEKEPIADEVISTKAGGSYRKCCCLKN